MDIKNSDFELQDSIALDDYAFDIQELSSINLQLDETKSSTAVKVPTEIDSAEKIPAESIPEDFEDNFEQSSTFDIENFSLMSEDDSDKSKSQNPVENVQKQTRSTTEEPSSYSTSQKKVPEITFNHIKTTKPILTNFTILTHHRPR